MNINKKYYFSYPGYFYGVGAFCCNKTSAFYFGGGKDYDFSIKKRSR